MRLRVDPNEFEKIYEQYKDMLYRIAFSYLKNNCEVEDVLQEVFIRRLYKAPSFESENHEKYWMIRLTINLSKNVLKSFWRKHIGAIDESVIANDMGQFDLSKSESALFDTIMSLPDKQKIAIYLHYYEGYSVKEIALILKCKESAIKMRLKKGRELLKLQMNEEESL